MLGEEWDKQMNEQEIEHARNIKIHDILGLRQSQRRVSVKCVFHTDSNPSLVIYPDNSFMCFGCGKHGKGAISFVMALGYNFTQAVNELKDL